jgi:hypothetical protein
VCGNKEPSGERTHNPEWSEHNGQRQAYSHDENEARPDRIEQPPKFGSRPVPEQCQKQRPGNDSKESERKQRTRPPDTKKEIKRDEE